MSTYNKSKPETIQAMFGSIAQQYDKTNSVLSFQLHRIWNKRLVQSVASSKKMDHVVDLCCGTGEIAFTYLKHNPQPCSMCLIDFCQEMLDCSKEKAKKLNLKDHQLSYMKADIQQIPLANQSVDCVTMAYGIRNVENPKTALEEIFRILKPGGRYGILELTQPDNIVLRTGHKFYLKAILPILGKVLTSNKEAYQYLCNSIHTFIKPKDLERISLNAGFEHVKMIPLHGGIATIIVGQKPEKQV